MNIKVWMWDFQEMPHYSLSEYDIKWEKNTVS